ncbi:6,7-dimethyl-8-ribityllumazine synthase [uncultured Lentibacter sp.]|jgi:6,7-dimethyl-8-ribityllumazine synthase|uniref:6,7-dimethyl-8-ribityllumazine synthase n=1 Tax=uncultured Lentibacter sp. TaxID=1659309 RepID=UPI0026020ACD|nr:6,7-dimethyl-8-ribityllumazine synthase [uncultured Lentibacter sp.]
MASSVTHHMLARPSFEAPVKLLIVVAPYYKEIADALVDGARSEITASGATSELVEVPGALEIPSAIAMAERLSNYDGYVALGCVVRGATTHYETVCNDSSRALTLLGLQGLNIGNGILTVENMAQAEERANPADMNKGGGAASAALHLVALARKWGGRRTTAGFKPEADSLLLADISKGSSPA